MGLMATPGQRWTTLHPLGKSEGDNGSEGNLKLANQEGPGEEEVLVDTELDRVFSIAVSILTNRNKRENRQKSALVESGLPGVYDGLYREFLEREHRAGRQTESCHGL